MLVYCRDLFEEIQRLNIKLGVDVDNDDSRDGDNSLSSSGKGILHDKYV